MDFDQFGISRPPQRRGLTERQIQELLSSEPVDESGMPLGPGTIANLLRLGKSVPGVYRRLRGMFSGRPQSTAPSNTLRDVVLSDKPSNVSRRAFLTNPVQTAVDIPQALREIGLPEESIKTGKDITVDQWGFADRNEKTSRDQNILGDYIEDRHSDIQPEDFASEEDRESGNPIDEWESGYDEYLDFKNDLFNSLQDIINKKLVRTGYGTGSNPVPGGLVRDFGTTMRVYRDQVLKDAAEKAGRSLEEQIKIELEEADKPGVVAKTADEIRRRYKR